MNKKAFCSGILVLALVLGLSTAGLASTPRERIDEATKVIREMTEQSDAESMSALLQKAKGVAIFPSVIRGGLGLGGRYGRGLLLGKDEETNQWHGPSFVEIKGVSYGWQIGLQSTALVLIITNERGMESFMDDQITLGGDISISAGPVGRGAELGTDTKLQASIYSYSMSRGAFAGAALGGSIISVDKTANQIYWQNPYTPEQILQRAPQGEEVESLIRALKDLLSVKTEN